MSATIECPQACTLVSRLPAVQGCWGQHLFGPGGWCLLLLMLVLALGPEPALSQQALPDRGNDVMAIVNGVVITRREFQVVYRQAVDRHAREGRPVDEAHLAAVRRAVIERMVEEELLYQESRRQGIRILEAEVVKAFDSARKRHGGDQAFTEELSRRSMDTIQFRRLLGRQLAVEQLLAREVAPNVTVAEGDIRRYYETHPEHFQIPAAVRLRHILVRRGEAGASGGESAARARIETIKVQLEAGSDFAAMARRFSEEPAAEQGGDLGFVARGQLLPPLEAVVFDLAVGEISPVVASDVGFHLLKATDQRAPAMIPFDSARADIHQILWQRQYNRALQAFIKTLRDKAQIQAAH
jgi:parvulin-like peptidyl-prolyl isomerase